MLHTPSPTFESALSVVLFAVKFCARAVRPIAHNIMQNPAAILTTLNHLAGAFIVPHPCFGGAM